MSIRSGDLNPPHAGRPVPHGTLQDLLLSMAFISSGPALWCFGAAILADQPDLAARLGQLRNLHGTEAAEALLGLLAAASGVLISIGAALSVLAVLTQRVAGRCSAWRMERLLAQLSPGFLRRSAALTLGAGLTLTGVAADSWPRATPTEVTSTLEGGSQSESAGGEHPDSALFDTTGPEDAPSPEADAPETPHCDRLQGLPQRRGAEPEQVVVRLGDSLWDIAADHLGADATDWEIASSWPRWYEANRQRIGADPGMILPGTVLYAPSA